MDLSEGERGRAGEQVTLWIMDVLPFGCRSSVLVEAIAFDQAFFIALDVEDEGFGLDR